MIVHGEIEYQTTSEEHGEHWVHSDICPSCCESNRMSDEQYREYLHKCLDEWLDKSNGTGAFYIAEEGFVLTQGQNGSKR